MYICVLAIGCIIQRRLERVRRDLIPENLLLVDVSVQVDFSQGSSLLCMFVVFSALKPFRLGKRPALSGTFSPNWKPAFNALWIPAKRR